MIFCFYFFLLFFRKKKKKDFLHHRPSLSYSGYQDISLKTTHRFDHFPKLRNIETTRALSFFNFTCTRKSFLSTAHVIPSAHVIFECDSLVVCRGFFPRNQPVIGQFQVWLLIFVGVWESSRNERLLGC